MNETINIPDNIRTKLKGINANKEDIQKLKKGLDKSLLPNWFIGLISNEKLTGVVFTLNEGDDLSKIGVKMSWKEPQDMIDELFDFYPGVAVNGMGYLPIGTCLLGSGDPYFIKMSTELPQTKLVRIRHDVVEDDDTYLEENIEIVCSSIGEFFKHCDVT